MLRKRSEGCKSPPTLISERLLVQFPHFFSFGCARPELSDGKACKGPSVLTSEELFVQFLHFFT